MVIVVVVVASLRPGQRGGAFADRLNGHIP